jgi:hypothetical protein
MEESIGRRKVTVETIFEEIVIGEFAKSQKITFFQYAKHDFPSILLSMSELVPEVPMQSLEDILTHSLLQEAGTENEQLVFEVFLDHDPQQSTNRLRHLIVNAADGQHKYVFEGRTPPRLKKV